MYSITHCNVENRGCPFPEYGVPAVVELAKAAAANAEAIRYAAAILRGSDAHMDAAFKIGAPAKD